MLKILILNGPNLNLLGQREPAVYGIQSLKQLETRLRTYGGKVGVDIECHQSNHEGYLIDWLQKAPSKYRGVVFNPGGYTHTSVALRDAIAAIGIPVLEVHISNIHDREEFRARSITAGPCAGQISGMGIMGYEVAIEALVRICGEAPEAKEARESRSEEEERGEDGTEKEKKRRRGRRGGRRRREREEQRTNQRGETESSESQPREKIDIEAKYSDLKGVSVRRGLDVLTETPDEKTKQATGGSGGQVSFTEKPRERAKATDEDQPLKVEPDRPGRPAQPDRETPREAPAPPPSLSQAEVLYKSEHAPRAAAAAEADKATAEPDTKPAVEPKAETGKRKKTATKSTTRKKTPKKAAKKKTATKRKSPKKKAATSSRRKTPQAKPENSED